MGEGLREKKNFVFEAGGGALKIRIYKELQIYTLQMLAFHLSLGLFTIILVNNVTFCQTKRYKIYNGCESMYT